MRRVDLRVKVFEKDNNLLKNRGLFGLMVTEVSFHAHLTPLLWAHGEADIMVGIVWWSKVDHFLVIERG